MLKLKIDYTTVLGTGFGNAAKVDLFVKLVGVSKDQLVKLSTTFYYCKEVVPFEGSIPALSNIVKSNDQEIVWKFSTNSQVTKLVKTLLRVINQDMSYVLK